MDAGLYIVGTPIGNLEDITLRALRILREVDVIFCEDTRRTLKLLNAYEIKKPLKSAPYFRERESANEILKRIQNKEAVAYVTDAGMPGISDPGAFIVGTVRAANEKVEIIGGVSSISHFLAGLGEELESVQFLGFLPPKTGQRLKALSSEDPILFFESSHRIEKTLQLVRENFPAQKISLAKELSKISEKFYYGTAQEILAEISSFKGEWIGLLWPAERTRRYASS